MTPTSCKILLRNVTFNLNNDDDDDDINNNNNNM
jgi:hypothetical protein